jgi:hypothetical protein
MPVSGDGALESVREVLPRIRTALFAPARRALARVLRPRLLRQGLAATSRGNLEAGFWLLREQVAHDREDPRAVQSFWDVAQALGRPQDAAGPMARLVKRQAMAGETARAVASWVALEEACPEAPVEAGTLVRLLPALKARVDGAGGEKARAAERAWLLRALRRSVEPGSGLSAGLALRCFDEARELDADVARRAARVALASPDLHQAKRDALEAQLRELDRAPASAPPEGPAEREAAPAAESLVVTEAAPVEIDERGLVLRDVGTGLRSRVPHAAVAAVSVARVAGLGPDPAVIVDLVLAGRPPAARGGRAILRLRGEAVANAWPASDGDGLRSFLSELLDHTHAAPLPDPDAVLGPEPRDFDDLAAYESQLLARLP